jgi:molybdopterin molybdotransferase
MSCCDQPGLMPLEDGISKILKLVTANQQTEIVPLEESHNRVTANAIKSLCNAPGFDNSAMDGYAIAMSGFSAEHSFEVQGKSFAGDPYQGTLDPSKTIRIMTGAVMPEGSDAVIIQENAVISDQGEVQFTNTPKLGENVRCAGEDIQQGQVIIQANTRIKPAHIALLASAGVEQVLVYRKTLVGLLSTGDELKPPGQPLNLGDIYNSNGPSIKSMLQRLNAEVNDYGIIPDDRDLFREAFALADQQCDFVVTSGGVSVGEADYTKEVLEEMGNIDFWKLAIKPGKPFAFGKLPNSYFIGLPGNPVSAAVTFHILAAQAIRQHQNIGYTPMRTLPAIALDNFKKAPGRMDFQRGNWIVNNRTIEVSTATAEQGSHILSSMANANCYIALEQDRGHVKAGEKVTIWLFDEILN